MTECKPSAEATDRSVYLTLYRVIDAPVEAVYAAWTEPDMLRRWLVPGNATVVRAVAEAAVGGTFLIEMRGPDGRTWLARGVYRDVVPNRRLVQTWRWEGSDVETLVAVEFEPDPAGQDAPDPDAFPVRARRGPRRTCAGLDRVPRETGEAVGGMSEIASTLRPDWVSDDMYPFESRFFATASGTQHALRRRGRRASRSCSCTATRPGRSNSVMRSGRFARSSAASRRTISASACRRAAPGARTIVRRVMPAGSPPCSIISTFATSPCS